MGRRELQVLTRDRLADARALLRAHRYCAAYYLAGYAVECALKACIAKKTERHDFPDRKKVNESYTNDLVKLVITAGLESELKSVSAADQAFQRSWKLVRDWSEEDRYNLDISDEDALELYDAITRRCNGVMCWLRNHW